MYNKYIKTLDCCESCNHYHNGNAEKCLNCGISGIPNKFELRDKNQDFWFCSICDHYTDNSDICKLCVTIAPNNWEKYEEEDTD